MMMSIAWEPYLVDLLFKFGFHFIEVVDLVFLFLQLILELLLQQISQDTNQLKPSPLISGSIYHRVTKLLKRRQW